MKIFTNKNKSEHSARRSTGSRKLDKQEIYSGGKENTY